MDIDKRFEFVKAHAKEMYFEVSDCEGIRIKMLSLSDLKVMLLLHKPEMPDTIESILNKYKPDNTDVSKWVTTLIQGSHVIKGNGEDNKGIESYKQFSIDASNEPFMHNWAKNHQAIKPAGKKKTTKKDGSTFRDIIQYQDKDKLLERLHYLIDGKGGAAVGIVLVRAKSIDGYLTRYPHEKEFVSEFELVGSWQGISNYFYKENDNDVLSKASNIVIFD